MSEEPQRFTNTNPQSRKAKHQWRYTYLDDGNVAILRDGEMLYVADSLEKALEWMSVQMKSGEQEP